MTDILADYREWADGQPTRVSTHSDRCHLWHEPCMIHRLARALERASQNCDAATLTDAEREAVETSFDSLQYAADELGLSQADCDRMVATLRGLLERTVEK
jgi:hypothetical protein